MHSCLDESGISVSVGFDELFPLEHNSFSNSIDRGQIEIIKSLFKFLWGKTKERQKKKKKKVFDFKPVPMKSINFDYPC